MNLIMLLNWQKIEEMICGKETLDLAVLKNKTSYSSYGEGDEIIKNFWKAMESFTNEERILYLRFVWGRSRLPDHNVQYSDKGLPNACTCFFTLKLPTYKTYDELHKCLNYAIHNCNEQDADYSVTTGAENFVN